MTDPERRVRGSCPIMTDRPPPAARFSPDPRRPYLGRAHATGPDGAVLLKSYDLTAWSGTGTWRRRVRDRCALIEQVTGGRTRFRWEGDRLIRVSTPMIGMRRLPGAVPLSRAGFAEIHDLLDRAHLTGLTHGDLTPRNVVTDGSRADLIDWEPILVGPGPAPAEDPAPERVTDPTRWLGGCDLLRLAPRDAPVSRLDLIGLNRLRRVA